MQLFLHLAIRWLLTTVHASPDNHLRSARLLSPLSLVSRSNSPLLVRLLLEYGADINARSNNTDLLTPLHIAAVAGQFATTKALIDRGANVHAVNARNETPLLALAGTKKGNDAVTCASLLIHAGAHVNQASSDGNLLPLVVALKAGNDKIAELLIAAGAVVHPVWIEEGSPDCLKLSPKAKLVVVSVLQAQ